MRKACFAALSIALVAACSKPRDASPAAAPSAAAPPPVAVAAAAPPLRMRPKTDRELPTTSASIYLANLDAEIGQIERLTADQPKDASRWRKRAGLHYSRAKIRGDLDEIAAAIACLDRAIALDPKDPDGYLARADEEQALHRFAAAQADVDRAKGLGAKEDAIAAAQRELDWNAGRYDAAIPAIRAARAKRETVWTIAREAQLDHDLGDEAAADRAFEEAEDRIVNTNPVPVAWLDVQRGVRDEKLGKLDSAVAFFREAVARIPSYVSAEEHLAEALHMRGDDDEAIAIYERVVQESRDPEFQGALASLYRARGRTAEADALRAKATRAYGALLAKYPEAMYWHAAEYFLGEGDDPKKGLDLLRKNVALRPNATSYVALARAALANGADAEAREAIDKALAMPLVSADLFATAARVYRRTGDAARADAYEARASGLPRAEARGSEEAATTALQARARAASR